ncbi:hypothetical protein MBLNU457_4736t2 [Dothideomycetes sp. NU457]
MSSTTVPSLLRPALGLVGWTFVQELWMYATRLPAMSKYDVKPDPNTIKEDMNKKMPPHIQWIGKKKKSCNIMSLYIVLQYADIGSKAENYNHLHEAPTRFYMVCAALAIAQVTSPSRLMSSEPFKLETQLAYTYLGLRIVHSLIQSTTNTIMVRFSCFAASETVMLALFYKAVRLIF